MRRLYVGTHQSIFSISDVFFSLPINSGNANIRPTHKPCYALTQLREKFLL